MLEVHKISWWLWLVTAGLLTAGLIGRQEGFLLAIVLGAFQVGYFGLREGTATAFPVQVRIAYLALLLLGQAPYMEFIYWIQFTGTWAMVVVGYCPLARMLSLFPWNRTGPLDLSAVKKAIFRRPVKGTVLQGFEAVRLGS